MTRSYISHPHNTKEYNVKIHTLKMRTEVLFIIDSKDLPNPAEVTGMGILLNYGLPLRAILLNKSYFQTKAVEGKVMTSEERL